MHTCIAQLALPCLRDVTTLPGSCPSKLDGEMVPSGFGIKLQQLKLNFEGRCQTKEGIIFLAKLYIYRESLETKPSSMKALKQVLGNVW